MDIGFPHLGIILKNVPKGIELFGFSIAFYGIIIAAGMLIGCYIAFLQGKRLDQKTEYYSDMLMFSIIMGIVGARAYFCIFHWDYYKDNPVEIFNIRGGGLAIYGGLIFGIITAYIYTRIKKVSFLETLDACVAGILAGQIMGRWGNFFNREAFGDYTDGLFAMQIPKADVSTSDITDAIASHITKISGTEYIQVHPTFLYESVWNLCIFLIIILYTKRRKYPGQLLLIYLTGYGAGRFWIEALRTDSLMLFGSGIAVSRLVSAILVIFAGGILIYRSVKMHKSV